MALRQVVPKFEAAHGPAERLVALRRFGDPPVFEFRPGGDLSELKHLVASHKRIVVNAAVGSGKSTRVPGELASMLGCVVIHLVPSVFLAADLSKYVGSCGVSVELIESVEQPMPVEGVALMSAACLVARWLQADGLDLPDVVLYHDEFHEADAYTYVVKYLAPTAHGLRSYIMASATLDAAGHRTPELAGFLTKQMVDDSVMLSNWDVYDPELPWSVEAEGNILIYCDNKDKAQQLVEQYASAGWNATRFHSRMPLAVFERAMAEARDPNQGLCVFVADNTFRSGYTMPVSIIVDTGIVSGIAVEAGKPVRKSRYAYEMERHQAAGRGARVAGQRTHYYFPSGDSPQKMSMVERHDMDAAAIIFRLLGYNPPRELSVSGFFAGKVPRELCAALNSATPLSLLGEGSLVDFDEFKQPTGRRSPFLQEGLRFNERPLDSYPGVSSDVAHKHGATAYVRDVMVEPLHVPEVEQNPLSEFSLEKSAEALGALLQGEDTINQLEVGNYYHAVGLYTDDLCCGMFPDGGDSVLRVLAKDLSHTVYNGWSVYVRSVAVAALLAKFNAETVKLKAISKVVREARQTCGAKDKQALRKWSTHMAEQMNTSIGLLGHISDAVVRISAEFCQVVVMSPLIVQEENLSSALMATVVSMPDSTVGPSEGFLSNVKLQIENELALEDKASIIDSAGALSSVSMSYHGKGSRLQQLPQIAAWAVGARGGSKVVRRNGRLSITSSKSSSSR